MLLAADIAARCKGAKKTGANQWIACCPAHADREPSLSISDGATKTVLHCHAGCETEAILNSLGVQFSELTIAPAREGATQEAVYTYTDETGFALYQVVRMKHPDGRKDFRQRAADWETSGRWSIKGIQQVPYKLPDVLAAKEVWIVEGEKDVERLAKSGLAATCNSGGAGNWRKEFATHFTGKTVYVIPDNDAPGIQHANAVAESLQGQAAAVEILPLPGIQPGEDVSDWLGTHTVGDLLTLRHQPPPVPAGAGQFKPVDIAPSFRPLRQWLMGTSHLRGVISLLIARGGTGKSSMLIAEALALATGKGELIIGEHVPQRCRVASIVLEDDWDEYHRRLEAATIHHNLFPEMVDGNLFVTCDHRARFGTGEGGSSPAIETWLFHYLREQKIDVLQIDPWVLAIAGAENDNIEIARITEGLTDLARAAGVCIRIAHHVRKSGSDATGDDARGASALLNSARIVQVLNSGMNDAIQAGEREEVARRVVRLDHDKANMSERQVGRYFELTPTYLQNGPNGGDSTAVTVPYRMPDVLADLTDWQIRQCVEAIGDGLPESSRSNAWAGNMLAAPAAINVSTDAGKNRMKKLIVRLVDQGILKTEVRSANNRNITYICPGSAGV